MRRWTWGLVVLAAQTAHADDAKPSVICDFDVGEPADGWSMRNVQCAEIATQHGRGLELSAESEKPPSGYGIERRVDLRDWRTFQSFSMQARVDAPVEWRLQVFRTGGGRLVRRFTLAPGAWREVVLRLGDFRDDGSDRAGSFADVERIQLQWDKGAGKVALDDLRVLPGDRGAASCRKTADDWATLGFGEQKARRTESEHFLLLDDVPAMKDADAKRLLARLEEGLQLLSDRYGVKGDLGERVPFFVFASRTEYESFVVRLGDHFGATVSPPKSDGFSIFGVGMSCYDPASGWDRPVFVHEALHGAIHRLLGIGSNGNWIQEGLANAVQVHLHPRTLDRAKMAESFENRGGWLVSWEKLFAQPRTAMTQYPQLLSIMDFLADLHRDALPRAWDAVREIHEPLNAAAPAAIASVLGTDAAKLEQQWLAWGAAYYRKKSR